MAVTVSRLLARTDLGLRPLTAIRRHDAPVSWAAATDLEDPTPFLTEGNIVLTTGGQFPDEHNDEAITTYVTRLRRFGIRAIGFGSQVLRDVPPALITACENQEVPLFDVPYRTPFLAVIRYIADLVTAEAHERTVWAADAQRTISLAAMRDDGLAASVSELARRLDRPVTLFDARGQLLHRHPRGGTNAQVSADAERMLARTVRAATTTDSGALLQTIGRGGDLRGVLAVEGPLDHAAQSVVAAVVALAGMALERQRSLVAATLRLRSGAWRSLLAGDVQLANELADTADLPESVTVGMLDDSALARAELTAQRSLFVARDGDRLVVLAADNDWADALYAEHGISAGLSRSASRAELVRAAHEATTALDRARRTRRPVTFDTIVDGGLRSLLDTDDAHALARALLAPLAQHDAETNTHLTRSLSTWLRHNGQWDPASRALGIHRHTLRSHVELAGRVLAKDLSDAETRAELLIAVTLAEQHGD